MSFRRAVHASPRLTALVRGVRTFIAGVPRPAVTAPRAPATDPMIPELRRIDPRPIPDVAWRFNLFLPSVDVGATFGGPRTALDVFDAIVPTGVPRRIVTHVPPKAIPAVLGDYEPATAHDERVLDRSLVTLEAATPALAVGRRDVFVTTFWNTADAAFLVREWQRRQYGECPPFLAYVIQDFEPGFYPWSAQHLLARATYGHPDETIAIFNSSLLRDYFRREGFEFAHELAFEPRLAAALRPYLGADPAARHRQVVVYGRPRIPRNAFPLVVEGLRRWRELDPAASAWSVVSSGQPHEDIDLGDGAVLRSIGKLDLDAYGRLLATSAVGVALMVSPHPSYPPLEMAALGLEVVTNRFSIKDLSTWHPRIATLADDSPDGLAAALTEACRRFEVQGGTTVPSAGGLETFLSQAPQFPFAAGVASLLLDGKPKAD
jgi:hypothetical protein